MENRVRKNGTDTGRVEWIGATANNVGLISFIWVVSLGLKTRTKIKKKNIRGSKVEKREKNPKN